MEFIKNNHELGRIEKSFIILLVVVLVGVGFFVWQMGKDKESQISNFDECVAAGNPVMESFPEKCTANGQTFTNSEEQIIQN